MDRLTAPSHAIAFRPLEGENNAQLCAKDQSGGSGVDLCNSVGNCMLFLGLNSRQREKLSCFHHKQINYVEIRYNDEFDIKTMQRE